MHTYILYACLVCLNRSLESFYLFFCLFFSLSVFSDDNIIIINQIKIFLREFVFFVCGISKVDKYKGFWDKNRGTIWVWDEFLFFKLFNHKVVMEKMKNFMERKNVQQLKTIEWNEMYEIDEYLARPRISFNYLNSKLHWVENPKWLI